MNMCWRKSFHFYLVFRYHEYGMISIKSPAANQNGIEATAFFLSKHKQQAIFESIPLQVSTFFFVMHYFVQYVFCDLHLPVVWYVPGPMFLLCCASWINMFKQNYKDIMLNIMALYWCFWKEESYLHLQAEFTRILVWPRTTPDWPHAPILPAKMFTTSIKK